VWVNDSAGGDCLSAIGVDECSCDQPQQQQEGSSSSSWSEALDPELPQARQAPRHCSEQDAGPAGEGNYVGDYYVILAAIFFVGVTCASCGFFSRSVKRAQLDEFRSKGQTIDGLCVGKRIVVSKGEDGGSTHYVAYEYCLQGPDGVWRKVSKETVCLPAYEKTKEGSPCKVIHLQSVTGKDKVAILAHELEGGLFSTTFSTTVLFVGVVLAGLMSWRIIAAYGLGLRTILTLMGGVVVLLGWRPCFSPSLKKYGKGKAKSISTTEAEQFNAVAANQPQDRAASPMAGAPATQPQVQQLEMMQVQCPPNAQAGTMIQIQTPSGQPMQVQVPTGIGPGMAFNVQVATASPANMTPEVIAVVANPMHPATRL
jgi:hypothetical protein